MMRAEVPYARSVQTLTCEVNVHPNLTEIPPLTTDNAQFEHVNLTQTTSVLVQCHLEDGSRSVECKSCPVEQWIRGGPNPPPTQVMAVPGNTLVTEKCVRCGLMLDIWPKEGCTGKHCETVPCPLMLAEVSRRLQVSRTEPRKRVFEEALKIVKSEVKLGRTFPTQELDAEFSPAPGPGRKNHPKTRQAETIPATPKTAMHHNIGDAEFGSPETPRWTGQVPAAQWSRRDTERNGSGIHGDDYVEPREHESVTTTNPSKSVFEVVVASTRVTGVDKLEESDKTMLWNHRWMENDEHERVD